MSNNSSKSPAYMRARMQVLAELSASADKEAFDPVLIRNGVFPERFDESELVSHWLINHTVSNEPLRFSELCRFNTWFALHPEKVAGKEIISASIQFPLTISGNKEDVIRTIQSSIAPKPPMTLKEKALQFKQHLHTGLAGEADELDGLEELGELVHSEISSNLEVLKKAVEHSRAEKAYSPTDTLSFQDVISEYNQGISVDEITAWVWYKRSLGIAMKGWEAYFLADSGEVGQMIYTTRATMIKDNHFRDLSEAASGLLLGKPTRFKNEYAGTVYIVFTALNGDKQYVAEKDIRIEKTSIKTDQKALDELVHKGVLFYQSGDLIPYPIYAYGNMYDRELELASDKDYIVSMYSEEIFSRHQEIIAKAKPELLSIFNPDEKMRPKILSISAFAAEFMIRELREETGIELAESEEGYSLTEAFFYYLQSLSRDQFKVSSAHDIWQYHVHSKKITDKDLSEEQRKELKANARNEGEELFSRFLFEGLTFADQEKLNLSWNRIYNGQSSIAYHRIPVGFECSAKFKQFNLHFPPAQREGVAFMEAVGSGIIAYDVGVGKTMTAIIALAQAIHSGKAVRPLIVVPNPTYGKWIKEIIGYTDPATKEFIPGVLSNTGIQLNEWYNLGTDMLKGLNLTKKIPARTITILTYEGFKKIGFSSKVMDQMFTELTNILYQSSEKSQRDKEIDYQKYREKIGVGLKGTEADIDTLGIDYIVIDEAHRCKNVFEGVKAGEDGKKRFGISGAVSETGIKAFFLCNYIQRTYGRNVMLLTATPFTNSPLEIYSMLSLVAYESMKKLGIYNIHTFFELFVLERTEYVVNYKEEIVPRDTVKSFNNRMLLQKLIYNHINYKTGEEAGVKRPCKINLPRINMVENGTVKRLPPAQQILTYLAMTPLQRQQQNMITAMAKNATNGQLNMSAIFRALNHSLDNALSPFLYDGTPEDYKEFVEESPKLKYVVECIASVKAWHEVRKEEVSGQVIYLNRGKDYFPLIKEYLEKETGYKTAVKWHRVTLDEVEIITSEMSQARKENIKEAFLDGAVKVIIGTATIREGIDLQRKGTVIYNCYPDWNPTDIRQLEGRIWRQGNEFGYIRSVMPLVQDSMDVFVFQKLEEKTSRINDIWYRGDRGNVLDLEALDPEEVKFALITDIDVIANMKRKQLKAEMQRRLSVVVSNLDTLSRFEVILRQFFSLREEAIEHVSQARALLANIDYRVFSFPKHSKKEIEDIEIEAQQTLRLMESFLESSTQSDKDLLRIGRILTKDIYPTSARNPYLFSEFKQYLSNVKKAEKTILAQKGFTINDNIQQIIEAYKLDQSSIEQEILHADSEELLSQLKEEAYMKKSAMAVTGATVEERAAEFARLNYLLSYKAMDVGSDTCQLPDKERASRSDTSELRKRKLKLKAKALILKLQLQQAA